MTKRRIVFVDDDHTEVDTFVRLFNGPQFEVIPVTARDPSDGFERVVAALEGSLPSLFVLDLYFPRSRKYPTGFGNLPAEGLQSVTSGVSETRRALDSLGASLEEAPDDGKRLLREAHAVVHRARTLLDRWCKELGQSPDGGLDLLKALEGEYPRVPAVFYSRKATLQDAKQALAAGALDVLSKPDASLEFSQAAKLADDFQRYADSEPPTFLAKWAKKVGFRIGWRSGPVAEVSVELEKK